MTNGQSPRPKPPGPLPRRVPGSSRLMPGQPPGAKSGYLPSVLTLLRAQQAPYLPASATLARLAGDLQIARIEFAAPSPLGLLSG